MQKNAELLKEWKALKEWGDISAIAKLLGKDHSQASRILSGQQNPIVHDLIKIKDFYAERKKMLKKLSK